MSICISFMPHKVVIVPKPTAHYSKRKSKARSGKIHSHDGGGQWVISGWYDRSVGVSNFGVAHLEALVKLGLDKPSVNQIELHPWQQKKEIVKYCQEHGIAVMGYSPLAKGQKVQDKTIVEIAKKWVLLDVWTRSIPWFIVRLQTIEKSSAGSDSLVSAAWIHHDSQNVASFAAAIQRRRLWLVHSRWRNENSGKWWRSAVRQYK